MSMTHNIIFGSFNTSQFNAEFENLPPSIKPDI